MVKKKSIYKTLIELWSHVGVRRRLQIYFLTGLYTLAALSEAMSLATLIPFLALLIDPARFDNYLPSFISEHISSDQHRIVLMTSIYLFLVVFSGVIRLITLWANNRISFMLGADISKEIYARTLNQPFSYFLGKNSSQLVDIMTKKSDALISGAIIPVLQSIGAFIYILILISVLAIISPKTTILLTIGVTLIYIIISYITKKKSSQNGLLITKESSGLIKSIQEAMQSKKELIINQSQDYFVNRYHAADVKLRHAESSTQFILHSPKIILEIIAIILMVILAFIFQYLQINSAIYIPVLAAFALGAQRLIPSLQQIYAALSNIRARQSMLFEVVNLLNLNTECNNSDSMPNYCFEHELRFENICFKYPGAEKDSLNHFNLVINKGDRIGIQGSSGAGKTTFINLLLGLIQPTSGLIYCDRYKLLNLSNSNWYQTISHVPQEVPILDATIFENVAYGLSVERINMQRVKDACQMANIFSDMEQMPQGLMTKLGESGEKLSGGQKQRIGLARAFYKNPKVLILDEFTSSLDLITEREIVKTISLLPNTITIIMISHRDHPLSICSKLVEIENGSVTNLHMNFPASKST